MGDVAAIITAAAAVAALIGGYVQFILRRALLPCIEFDVEYFTLSRSAADHTVGEVLLRISNVGPGVGYVTNVRCRVRYRLAGESGVALDEPHFAHRLPAEGFFELDSEKRFIQPGITQFYRKPLVFAGDTCLVHAWGQFEYEISVGRITKLLAKLLRHPHARNLTPYAVRRTFAIGDDSLSSRADRLS
jgi:hypothetical protein